MKCEATPADPLRLILDQFACPAADAHTDPAQPIPEGPAEFHLARAGPKRLCLEIKQDQAGVRTEWHAKKFERAIPAFWTTAWFYNEPYLFNRNLPGLVVRQPSMGKGTLRPARVNEIERTVLVAHICCGSFHDAAIKTGFKSALLSSRFQQLVDGAHGVDQLRFFITEQMLPQIGTVVAVDFGEQAIWKNIRFYY